MIKRIEKYVLRFFVIAIDWLRKTKIPENIFELIKQQQHRKYGFLTAEKHDFSLELPSSITLLMSPPKGISIRGKSIGAGPLQRAK